MSKTFREALINGIVRSNYGQPCRPLEWNKFHEIGPRHDRLDSSWWYLIHQSILNAIHGEKVPSRTVQWVVPGTNFMKFVPLQRSTRLGIIWPNNSINQSFSKSLTHSLTATIASSLASMVTAVCLSRRASNANAPRNSPANSVSTRLLKTAFFPWS